LSDAESREVMREIYRRQERLMQLHKCSATWRETVPVHEVFRGQAVWQGEV
jgi:hypothetical protein